MTSGSDAHLAFRWARSWDTFRGAPAGEHVASFIFSGMSGSPPSPTRRGLGLNLNTRRWSDVGYDRCTPPRSSPRHPYRFRYLLPSIPRPLRRDHGYQVASSSMAGLYPGDSDGVWLEWPRARAHRKAPELSVLGLPRAAEGHLGQLQGGLLAADGAGHHHRRDHERVLHAYRGFCRRLCLCNAPRIFVPRSCASGSSRYSAAVDRSVGEPAVHHRRRQFLRLAHHPQKFGQYHRAMLVQFGASRTVVPSDIMGSSLVWGCFLERNCI